MLKLFVGPEKEGVGVIRLLAKYRNSQETSSRLFQPVEVPVQDIIEIVSSIATAHMILFAHDYSTVAEDRALIASYENLAETSGKKILVFSYTDKDLQVPMRNAIVLRTSTYRYKMEDTEIIIPPFIEDLGSLYGVLVRHKTNTLPVIGFIGLANWGSVRTRTKAYIRQLFLLGEMIFLSRKKILAHTQGIFIRRHALRVLKKSSQVRLLSVIRSSYSALKKTIEISPEQARAEYVQSIQDSDFYLAPKGDGNYSLRFYEALSLGRIPVLIDTETVLPFEDRIKYDDVIIRVSLQDIKNIGNIIADVYRNMTDDEFVERQQGARKIFEEFLKPEKFYSILFNEFATQFHSG